MPKKEKENKVISLEVEKLEGVNLILNCEVRTVYHPPSIEEGHGFHSIDQTETTVNTVKVLIEVGNQVVDITNHLSKYMVDFINEKIVI